MVNLSRRISRVVSVAFAICIAATIIKAAYLQPSLGPSRIPLLACCSWVIQSDWLVWTVFTIAVFTSLSSIRFFKVLAYFFILIVTTWYAIDTQGLVVTNQRFSRDSLSFVITHYQAIPDMVHWQSLIIFIATVFCGIIFRSIIFIAALCSIFIMLCTGIFWPLNNTFNARYRFDYSYILNAFSTKTRNEPFPSELYSAEEVSAAKQFLTKKDKIDSNRIPQRIVILVLESMSSSFSDLHSGLSNSVPVLDALGARGTVFPNTLANGLNTNYGFSAITSGIPPIGTAYARNNPYYILSTYASHSRVLERLQSLGWTAEIISGYAPKVATVNFNYLTAIGFDKIRFPPMWDGKKESTYVSNNSVSDADVLETAKQRLSELILDKGPFLLFIETSDGHKLWGLRDATNPPVEHLEVLQDTSLAITNFVETLDENYFFEDGLLIITSDHRIPGPISNTELTRFGESAPYRIPLTIIGKGVYSGAIDNRLIQQADILPKLGEILSPGAEVTDAAICPGQFRTPIIKVFDPEYDPYFQKSFTAELDGKNLSWIGDQPERALEFETKIHQFRAAYQK